MTGLPTIRVQLDDGTGTWPYDISPYVRLTSGIDIVRGRQDEQGAVSPSTLTLTLENFYGDFTLGGRPFGTGPFGVGPFGVPAMLDTPIRVTETVGATSYIRFTGYVQSWPVAWPTGGEEYALTQVTAVDGLARMARKRLRSLLEEVILVADPVAYYPFNEPEGSTAAYDATGQFEKLDTIDAGSSFIFGASTGPGFDDAPTGISFTDGDYLASRTKPLHGTTQPTTIEFWLYTTTSNQSVMRLGNTGFSVSAGGFLNVVGDDTLVSGLPVGILRHYCITDDGTTSALYVNSVLQDTGTTLKTWQTSSLTGIFSSVAVGNGLTGDMFSLAIYDHVLTPTEILIRVQAGFAAFALQRSDFRVALLAVFAGILNTALEVGKRNVGTQSTAGSSLADAVQAVADSENGLVFINGAGQLVMQNGDHRAAKATPNVTYNGYDVDPGTNVVGDTAKLINAATVSYPYGADQTVYDFASIATHGEYQASLTTLLGFDYEAAAVAAWLVATHAEASVRLPGLGVDLLTQTQAIQQSTLALELSDRIDLANMPVQATVQPQIIEGWTEHIDATSWSITFNTTPFSLYQAWVLGDATYGVLDSTTRLSA